MKRSSKIISLALSVTMAASCFAGFSICSASAADDETKVYFEVPTLESWGTTKSVFCHIYRVYGGSPLTETSWGSPGEKCKLDEETGLYYFDTAKLGTIEEGADYAILFHTKDTNKAPHQTGNVTFGKECLGDTIYVTGEMVENTEDSSKMDYEGAWKNNSDKYGAMAAITSTGKIVGKKFPLHQPKEQKVAQYIASWAVKNAESAEGAVTPEKLTYLCSELGVTPEGVYAQYASDYAEQLADPVTYPLIAPLTTVADLLGVDPEPATTEPATEPETTEPATTEPATTEPATTEPATEPEPQILYGDVDQDGKISIQDATEIQRLGLGIGATEGSLASVLADVNGDGRISILDVTCVQMYLCGGYKNTGRVGTALEVVG
ncbi:dockerin type I domain-containing protein [Ruminococcus sp.]|uniref:dockerin type I domain-containing protein n=1 Tax=Ruminococcus sp. TaxID=41978 RepID=UPI0025F48C26|nr:dockerin type I domain-containing protein [Ruminococcus sp.]MCI6616776.1 dockerin type I repeat-containing protein [Ruminococcus sp.]